VLDALHDSDIKFQNHWRVDMVVGTWAPPARG
jgi:hypothetical protein